MSRVPYLTTAIHNTAEWSGSLAHSLSFGGPVFRGRSLLLLPKMQEEKKKESEAQTIRKSFPGSRVLHFPAPPLPSLH